MTFAMLQLNVVSWWSSLTCNKFINELIISKGGPCRLWISQLVDQLDHDVYSWPILCYLTNGTHRTSSDLYLGFSKVIICSLISLLSVLMLSLKPFINLSCTSAQRQGPSETCTQGQYEDHGVEQDLALPRSSHLGPASKEGQSAYVWNRWSRNSWKAGMQEYYP